jgi:hypothetical protein
MPVTTVPLVELTARKQDPLKRALLSALIPPSFRGNHFGSRSKTPPSPGARAPYIGGALNAAVSRACWT